MAAFSFSDPRLIQGTTTPISNIAGTIAKGTAVGRTGLAADPSDADLTVEGIAITDGDAGESLVVAKNGSTLKVTEDIIPGRTYVSVGVGTYDLEENLPVGETYRKIFFAESNDTVRLTIDNTSIVKVADA